MTHHVSLASNLAPPFYSVHHDIKRAGHTHYWLYGGRGSTKSSFAAIEAVLDVLHNPDANAIYLRKVADTLRDSCYTDVLWALDVLGVSHLFSSTTRPMEIVRKSTGQRIYFRGADKPDKLKSMKPRTGYFSTMVFEEVDQFLGEPELRKLRQTFMRSGNAKVFYLWNPPRTRDAWVNKHIQTLSGKQGHLLHKSSYLDVPRQWLGDQFFDEADDLRLSDEQAYLHEYLGDAVGTGGNVFYRVDVRRLTDEEILGFGTCYNGVDFGWWPDPWVFVRCYFDRARRTLYVFDEVSGNKISNDKAAALIRERLTVEYTDGTSQYLRELVTCDSAEPKSITDYRSAGVRAQACTKRPGSVDEGIKWLQSLRSIVVDPVRCPLTAREFSSYEYQRTRGGEYCSSYPDKDNHTIDAVRYALEPVMERKSKR